jgi:hypothetical protein
MMPLVKLIAIYLGRWLRPIMVKRFLTSGGLKNVISISPNHMAAMPAWYSFAIPLT